VDLTRFPQITHNEKDVAPYLTAGHGGQRPGDRDPERRIYRHMAQGKDQMGIHLAETSHSNLVFEKCCQMGKPMEVAVTVGCIPPLPGALSFVPFGVDEYTVVGGLMEEPLEVVKCETVDLEVPARAEIVIEGIMNPNHQRMEGPFGEFTTLYGKPMMNPVIDVTALR